MNSSFYNATLLFYPTGNPKLRLFALWYFTTLMIVWNILGHTVLGFEQSWAAPVTAVLTAIGVSMLLEWVDATAKRRPLRFAGGPGNFLNFLPACLIPGFACAMLLFTNERLAPLVFAVVLSMSSKVLIRAPVGNGHTQHIFNPSNFGVAATLLLLPDVSFAPPYHFTENITGLWDWIVPLIVLTSGLIVHGLFTGRLPLVAAWISAFIVQALIRASLAGAPLFVPLMPMTSAAFIIFTLYMIPDPATTPLKPSRQVLFGAAVAFVYGTLQMMHVVFGLFFALVIVCACRGASMYLLAGRERWQRNQSGDSTGPSAAALAMPAAASASRSGR